jgi:hypothetical protein
VKTWIHLLCALLSTAVIAAVANAAILDFEDLVHHDSLVVDHGPVYTHEGYVLTNTATEEESGFPPSFASFGTLLPEFTGSTALFNDNFNGTTVLTRTENQAFQLRSISLAELAASEPFSVVFSGLTAGGVLVTETVELDGAFGMQTFAFGSEFRDLVSVSWDQTAPYHQFDNINVNVIPEPHSLLLLGSGLLALLTARNRLRLCNVVRQRKGP